MIVLIPETRFADGGRILRTPTASPVCAASRGESARFDERRSSALGSDLCARVSSDWHERRSRDREVYRAIEMSSWDYVCEVMSSLPGTDLDADGDHPAWRVKGAVLVRRNPMMRVPGEHAVRAAHGELVAVRVFDAGERALLLGQAPARSSSHRTGRQARRCSSGSTGSRRVFCASC